MSAIEGDILVPQNAVSIMLTDIARVRMGRPAKLTDEIVERAWQYISDSVQAFEEGNGQLITKERLALKIGITRETLYKWAESNDDFSDILATLDTIQADTLIQNGLTNKYNPTIAKMMLSKHGYVEKSESDVKVEAVQPILGGSAKQIPEESDEQV